MLLAARLALVCGLSAPIAGPSAQLLFQVERTTNANIVEYAARIARDGRIEPDEPFEVSWRMLASDGHREPLNFFERQFAYGLTARRVVARARYELQLAACKDRTIVVTEGDDGYRAELVISGVPSRLRTIFVHTEGGGLAPKVVGVELRGESLQGGAVTTELLRP